MSHALPTAERWEHVAASKDEGSHDMKNNDDCNSHAPSPSPLPSQKKRKISPSNEGADDYDFQTLLYRLPDGPFSRVFEYASKESRASFAVAISAPPSSFRRHYENIPEASMKRMRAILSGKI